MTRRRENRWRRATRTLGDQESRRRETQLKAWHEDRCDEEAGETRENLCTMWCVSSPQWHQTKREYSVQHGAIGGKVTPEAAAAAIIATVKRVRGTGRDHRGTVLVGPARLCCAMYLSFAAAAQQRPCRMSHIRCFPGADERIMGPGTCAPAVTFAHGVRPARRFDLVSVRTLRSTV